MTHWITFLHVIALLTENSKIMLSHYKKGFFVNLEIKIGETFSQNISGAETNKQNGINILPFC